MNSLSDQELLRDYAERRAEPAFAELVRRHIDLVHSAALRMVRDTHLAEDVTQGAFVALARSAAQLTDRAVLSGWLHRTAQNIAAQTVRTDARRRAREQEAAAMNELLPPETDGVWEQIKPHLDAALGALSEPDRDALLLRYFEGKSAQEMAQVLGVSHEAAQKRVTRAVERLREYFSQRGVTIGPSGLAVVISTYPVQAAPIGLATTISAAAGLAGKASIATMTATVAQSLAMTTPQKVLIAAAMAAAVGTGIYEARQASTSRKLADALQQQTALTEQRTSDRDAVMRQLVALRAENERLIGGTAELLKLRGEVYRLSRVAAKVELLESALARSRSGATEEIPPGASKLIISNPYLGREVLSDKGTDSPYHALETMLWASMTGNSDRLADTIVPGESPGLLRDRPPLVKIKGVQIVSVDGHPDGVTRIGAIVEDAFYGGGLDKPPGTVQNTRSWYLVQTNGEWKVTGEKASW